MSTLSARNLSKTYSTRKVVSDISLEISSGETIGLLGPNGAGKTTSFYMIVGLVPLDNGNIYLDDKEIGRLSMDKRSYLGLGYLPQESSIFKGLTVEDNIMAILEIRYPPYEAKKNLEHLLDEFSIAHLRNNLAVGLSGGERRRLEIARALALKPKFLLLDEPFAGVDPISVSDIQQLIRKLCDYGLGILITDHNVRETLDSCDRAYVVGGGKIIAEGSSEHILENKIVKETYLGDTFSLYK